MGCNIRHRFTAITLLLAMTSMVHAQAENMDTIVDAPHLAAYFVAALMITVFVMIFTNRLYYFREQEIVFTISVSRRSVPKPSSSIHSSPL